MPDATSDPGPGPLPEAIGGYRVQRVLGRGGMATVYAALQARPRRTVAIKVLHGMGRKTGPGADPDLRRFRREAEILGKLRHPGIAQIIEAGTWENEGRPCPYLVMEYVPRARTLLQHMEARELDRRARLRLFVQVCAAVGHGHRRKIVHRDLKPGNVLVDESGQPKVIDYGVASAPTRGADPAPGGTGEGRIVGTLRYMSPEQLDPRPRDVDARCDVYALGVMLYEALTGRMPYQIVGLPDFTAAQIIREDAPMRPGAIVPELRGDLEAIVMRALEKDPARRYRDAGGLGRDLVRFLSDRPVEARPAGAFRRLRLLGRRHRAALTAAAVVALVIATAAAAVLLMRPQPGGAVDGGGLPSQPAAAAGRETGRDVPEPASVLPPPPPPPRRGPVAGPARFREQTDTIEALRFARDGRWLACGSADHSLVVLDVPGRRALFTALDHDVPVRHVAIAADGRRVLTAAADGFAVLLDAGGEIVSRRRHGASAVHCLAMSRDGAAAALGLDDLTLRIWSLPEGPEKTVRGTTGVFRSAAFDAAGARLAGGTAGGDVIVWDVATGGRLHRFDDLSGPIVAVHFVAEPDGLIAVSREGEGRRWRLDRLGGASRRFHVGLDPVRDVSFDPAGQWMAVADDTVVHVWELGEAMRRRWRTARHDAIGAVAIAPGGGQVAIGDVTGLVDVVDVE